MISEKLSKINELVKSNIINDLDDRRFCINLIISHCVYLLESIQFLKDGKKIYPIYPLLRNIHDSIIIVVLLYENEMNFEEAISKNKQLKKIKDLFKKYEPNEYKINTVDDYLNSLKNILNNQSHVNILSLASTHYEAHANGIEKEELIEDIRDLIVLYENLFIGIVNSFYGSKISKQLLKENRVVKFVNRIKNNNLSDSKLIERLSKIPNIDAILKKFIEV
jgi:hypothetical protein